MCSRTNDLDRDTFTSIALQMASGFLRELYRPYPEEEYTLEGQKRWSCEVKQCRSWLRQPLASSAGLILPEPTRLRAAFKEEKVRNLQALLDRARGLPILDLTGFLLGQRFLRKYQDNEELPLSFAAEYLRAMFQLPEDWLQDPEAGLKELVPPETLQEYFQNSRPIRQRWSALSGTSQKEVRMWASYVLSGSVCDPMALVFIRDLCWADSCGRNNHLYPEPVSSRLTEVEIDRWLAAAGLCGTTEPF